MFRNCLRMERFDPGRDDHAFAVQFVDADRSCVSRGVCAMNRCAFGNGKVPLKKLGEDRLLDQILQPSSRKAAAVGLGDDCAVLKIKNCTTLLVFKTDCVVEGVHFSAATTALAVGWKAMMRPLS